MEFTLSKKPLKSCREIEKKKERFGARIAVLRQPYFEDTNLEVVAFLAVVEYKYFEVQFLG